MSLSSSSSTVYNEEVEDEKALLADDGDWKRQELRRGGRSIASWLVILVGTIFIFVLGTGLGLYLGRDIIDPSNNRCVDHLTQATPILDEVGIKLHTQRFNGSFMHENVYRLPGSPEVDEAWEALGVNYRAMRLPENLAKAAGLTKDHIRIKEKYGGGYPVNVEGLHHLHCLNLIRQGLYYNIDYYKARGKDAFINSDHIVQRHISHCVDILRQQLMCNVDVGVFGQVWYVPSKGDDVSSFVDFNTDHKCRNYDDVRQWAKERQLPPEDSVPQDLLEPPTPDTHVYQGVP